MCWASIFHNICWSNTFEVNWKLFQQVRFCQIFGHFLQFSVVLCWNINYFHLCKWKCTKKHIKNQSRSNSMHKKIRFFGLFCHFRLQLLCNALIMNSGHCSILCSNDTLQLMSLLFDSSIFLNLEIKKQEWCCLW